jgi:hypothetical protein
LTKEQKKQQIEKLKAENHTLSLEKQGNRIVGAYLAALDRIGERQGLQLSDFTLTTNPVVDFISDHDFMMQAGCKPELVMERQ